MIFDIDKYLKKNYKKPVCWALVTDIYLNEFNFNFKEVGLDIENQTIEKLQSWFIASIQKYQLFRFIEKPEEGAIVLMYKNYTDRPDHCGIYVADSILHASQTMVVRQSLHQIKDIYSKVEFGVLNVH